MADIIEIKSIFEERLSLFSNLTEAQLRRGYEEKEGVFIAEGIKVIRVALNAGYIPVAALMPKRFLFGQGAELFPLLGDIPVYTADGAVLEKLAGYAVTRGVLCAFKRPKFMSAEEACGNSPVIAVAENITDAANLGAMIRSAAAFDVGAILFTPSCADPFNRRTVRVSMGTLFQTPFARIGEDPAEWPQNGVERLRRMGYKTAALALSDNFVSVSDPALKKEKKLALILGNEGDGLCKETIKLSDYVVKIPMSHGVDSLNVAAAAAVAFWEFTRKE